MTTQGTLFSDKRPTHPQGTKGDPHRLTMPESKQAKILQDRSSFWSRVELREPNQCWHWRGGCDKGYGRFYSRHLGGYVRAHRAAWILTHGPLSAGIVVCHDCDTPACVNPKHLFIGSSKDNVDDAMAKGRMKNYRGEKHINSKLTRFEVVEVRRLCAAKVDQRLIGRMFRIGQATVSDIYKRRSWAHIS